MSKRGPLLPSEPKVYNVAVTGKWIWDCPGFC
jgi:hypothetical protein